MATTLIVPGLGGSGEGHWQHWWLKTDPDAVLVEQADWRHPCPDAWERALVEAVGAHPYAWLVAHGLGVALVARVAAGRLDLRIAGALLVGAVDVEGVTWASGRMRGFAPMSLAPLPFPATLVASRNDRSMRFRRAKALAAAWGARLVDQGEAGHINAASGYGPWPEGQRLLEEVRARRRYPAMPLPFRSAPESGRVRA
jgi:predicted alpha/beta hydrolase family esterase